MKSSLSTLLALAGALLAVALAPVGATAAPQPSANGNGDIGPFQSFSFSTRGFGFAADGHVTVTEPSTDPNTRYRGQVNCAFYLGNQVVLTGNITSAPVSPFFQPTDFVAFAEDNGEPGALRDRWGFFVLQVAPGTPPPSCFTSPFFFGSVLTSGNIDVDP